jgi:transcriptional regulator with XRE-family HTH domain
MGEPVDAVLDAVGPRLRALRRKQNTTLNEVAEATGISVSTLSRLESGHRRPTLEMLLLLARAHKVPLDELVGSQQAADPRVRARPIEQDGRTYLPLTRRPGGMRAYKIVLAPGHPELTAERKVHDGHEWLYVLSGRVRLVLGDQDLVLSPGEAAEFETHVPHWIGNAGSTPAELISLYGPQGERVHVRAPGDAAGDATA